MAKITISLKEYRELKANEYKLKRARRDLEEERYKGVKIYNIRSSLSSSDEEMFETNDKAIQHAIETIIDRYEKKIDVLSSDVDVYRDRLMSIRKILTKREVVRIYESIKLKRWIRKSTIKELKKLL